MRVEVGLRRRSGRPLCVAVGVFDGVHVGHRRVIGTAVDIAVKSGLMAGVMTFDPHPAAALDPKGAPPQLTTTSEKLELFRGLGVSLSVVTPFDMKLAQMSARSFIEDILVGQLRARCIVVGDNWRFGARAEGTSASLKEAAKELGLAVRVVPAVVVDGVQASSTRIRQLLLQGKVGVANDLLGRRYALGGPVTPGDRRGRMLGFPTVNLAVPECRLIPADGVYVGRSGAKKMLPAVGYVGSRPTFDGNSRRIEVHFLGRTPWYAGKEGQYMKLELIQRLRSDRKFRDSESLAQAMERDCAQARAVLEGYTQ